MEPIFFMEIYNNYTINQKTKKQVDNESEQNCKQDCKQDIMTNCNHEFVKDMIDITPEQSMNICYCVKCGFTR